MIAVGVLKHAVEEIEGVLGKVFRSRNTTENHGSMVWYRLQKLDNLSVTGMNQESVIPMIDEVLLNQCFDFRKIHNHAVGWITRLQDDIAAEGDFECVAMAVQMTTPALVIRNTVTGIKFEAAGDQH